MGKMMRRKMSRMFRYRLILGDDPPDDVRGLKVKCDVPMSNDSRKLRILEWKDREIEVESYFRIPGPASLCIYFLICDGDGVMRGVKRGVKEIVRLYPYPPR